MSKMRHLKEMRKLSWIDIYEPREDSNQREFGLHLNFDEKVLNNTRLPGEISKVLNANAAAPELQHMNMPVFDEESAENFRAVEEVQKKYMSQKWKYYLNSKSSQYKMNYQNMVQDEEHAQ
mmetsp:Transcript_42638/g.57986  ORF Transcript_42638/g.57986 Transcript_42638/m.57986 type:complete len:121 (+) Transcript_42638:1272-1634(+)